VKIFLPVSLDQWRSPIASLLRAVVNANQYFEFESFSNPLTVEDRDLGDIFWEQNHVNKISPRQAFGRRYDLVHTACLNPRNLAAACYTKMLGFGKTQFLTTLNLEYDSGMPSRDWRCYQAALKFCDHFVAVSKAVAQRVINDAPDRFLGVIPNGFDDEFYDPTLKTPLHERLLGHPGGYAFWVSALEPRKHPEFLIGLARFMPHITFVAAGWEHPFYAESYLPEIRTLKNIIWMGHVEQSTLRSLLAHARVLIFPSEREGLPLSVIEAMGMGLPVVAQPKSSLPELINRDICGQLFSIDHEDSIRTWSNAINHYMTRNSVDRFLESTALSRETKMLYSWKRVGSCYASIYRKINENL
jgi:glycosyltransferase involved in cell wall biosynthesis